MRLYQNYHYFLRATSLSNFLCQIFVKPTLLAGDAALPPLLLTLDSKFFKAFEAFGEGLLHISSFGVFL